MMKINQDKLTPQVLDKIREVNEEAGRRTYLEVPEMIRIICEAVEANYNVIPMNREEIKEYTRYFVEIKAKDNNAGEWYPHTKLGEESYEEAKGELKHLKTHFSKNFKFRIVKRDYTYQEAVLE
jgi:hypothetical protein